MNEIDHRARGRRLAVGHGDAGAGQSGSRQMRSVVAASNQKTKSANTSSRWMQFNFCHLSALDYDILCADFSVPPVEQCERSLAWPKRPCNEIARFRVVITARAVSAGIVIDTQAELPKFLAGRSLELAANVAHWLHAKRNRRVGVGLRRDRLRQEHRDIGATLSSSAAAHLRTRDRASKIRRRNRGFEAATDRPPQS